MDQDGLGLYGVYREPRRKNIGLVHKDQLAIYGHEDHDQTCAQFSGRYRFKEETVRNLARLYGDEIGPKVPTNNASTTEERINCALRYFATGTFQTEVGDGEGISQSSMHRHIAKVSDVFAREADKIIRFSTSPDILEKNSQKFFGFNGRVPNVVGVIDGTHVKINGPWINPEQYVNRDGYMSIAVQVLINYRGAFTHLSARWPGSLHDSRILQESDLQNILNSGVLGTNYILGDSGYACQRNLITPFPYQNRDQQQAYYNECFCKVRCKVECVIGMWKRKFPCLKKGMEYQPDRVTKIIKACGFLWNYGILVGDNKGYNPDDFIIPNKQELDEEIESTTGGRLVRESVKSYLWRNKNRRY